LKIKKSKDKKKHKGIEKMEIVKKRDFIKLRIMAYLAYNGKKYYGSQYLK
jgi:hypothetical protein